MIEVLARAFAENENEVHSFRSDPQNIESLAQVARFVADAFKRRGRVFACGNGGSMADAMHFAEEWTGRFHRDRQPYPAMALGEAAHMTCVANDYGFEHVFARQLDAFGHEGDVVIILTTSGNSPNLLEAAKVAKERGVKVIGFVGRGGGLIAPFCDLVLNFPGKFSDRIQEVQMLALHALIEAVELELGHGSRLPSD